MDNYVPDVWCLCLPSQFITTGSFLLYFEILVHFRNHFYSDIYKNGNTLRFCSGVQLLQMLFLHLHAVLGKIGSLPGVSGAFWIYWCGSNRERWFMELLNCESVHDMPVCISSTEAGYRVLSILSVFPSLLLRFSWGNLKQYNSNTAGTNPKVKKRRAAAYVDDLNLTELWDVNIVQCKHWILLHNILFCSTIIKSWKSSHNV